MSHSGNEFVKKFCNPFSKFWIRPWLLPSTFFNAHKVFVTAATALHNKSPKVLLKLYRRDKACFILLWLMPDDFTC